MSNELTITEVNKENALEVFTSDVLDDVLKKITEEVDSFVPDLTTVKGRKAIASLSAKVSKSKVVLDGFGKELVADWKANAKRVDEARKKSRDYLDTLRDKARQPLTDWENEQKAIEEAERLKKEQEEEAERVRVENERIELEKKLAEAEAEVQRQKEEARQKIEAAAAEKRRIEEQERIKKEAEEAARVQAEQEIKKAKEDAERRIREETERAERAEKERVEAAQRAEVERKLAAQKAKEDAERAAAERVEAAERATREQEQAVLKAQREAEEKAQFIENERLANIARLKEIEDARKADEDHRRSVNRSALDSIVNNTDLSEEQAKSVIAMIIKGNISNITINY